jgi:Tfp pilus tip-associated adhesin PilY1
MVKLQIDPTTHAVTNAAALAALGMGTTAAEAEQVTRWMLGDPAYGNPAILGAIINSTPIDVASPGDISEPGGHDFFLLHQNRPHLIYVGSSDGMLHAFFLVDTTVGANTYSAGTEAFAFLPPDMMPAVRQQYTQGGQKPDPYAHIFGLANSPKSKTMCVQHCSDAATAVWKTLLIMPEGYGGSDTFMLDVTDPFTGTGIADPPVSVRWHTAYVTGSAVYNTLLGNTISLPAFFFNKTTGMDDYRVLFASGYPVTDGSTTQGRSLVSASAATGAILTTNAVAPGAACAQEYTALTDVATARDFA